MRTNKDFLPTKITIPKTDIVPSKFDNRLLKMINELERIIIISPHLDDSILSMGALISYAVKIGVNVEVISIFTEGSSLKSVATRTLLGNAMFTDPYEYFTKRRNEDIEALESLGNIKIKHLGFIDSAWRTNKNGDPLYSDSQLSKLDEEDVLLQNQIKNKLLKLIKNNNKKTRVFAPLARGSHADHQIARNATNAAQLNAIYYEDFPYSTLYENEDTFIKENNLINASWFDDYELKKKAILKYESQNYSLFYLGKIKLPLEKYYFSSAS